MSKGRFCSCAHNRLLCTKSHMLMIGIMMFEIDKNIQTHSQIEMQV